MPASPSAVTFRYYIGPIETVGSGILKISTLCNHRMQIIYNDDLPLLRNTDAVPLQSRMAPPISGYTTFFCCFSVSINFTCLPCPYSVAFSIIDLPLGLIFRFSLIRLGSDELHWSCNYRWIRIDLIRVASLSYINWIYQFKL